MNNYMVSIIIIIIIILLYIISRKNYINDSFRINTDITSSGTKTTNEIYTLPCIGCIRNDNKLKPHFKYQIPDNRCVLNDTDGYIDSAPLINMINYTSDPLPTYSSCETTYNSLYSSINGRYIRIIRNDSTQLRLRHISVHDKLISNPSLSIGKFIFVDPIYKSTSNVISYPDAILDSPDSVITTFQTGTATNLSYISIDLGSNMDIGFIVIKHNNSTDAASLNNAYVLVLRDNDQTGEMGTLVFHKQITGNDITRIIYTQNYKNPTLPTNVTDTMRMTNTFTWPCDNCTTSDLHLFKNSKYNVTNQCYKPKDFTSVSSDLNNIGTLSPTGINNKFASCDTQLDTRRAPANGRFIQFYRLSGVIAIKFNKITIYSNYTYEENIPFAAYVHSIKDSNSVFANALDTDYTTNVSTSDTSEAMIHIDLGINKDIVGIKLDVGKSDERYITDIICYVIKIDPTDPFNNALMKATCMITLNQSYISSIRDTSNVNVNTYIIPINTNMNDSITNIPSIILNREVNYDPTNKYITTYIEGTPYYQIPYLVYNVNNRKFIAKTKTLTTKLNNLNNSDGYTLFNINTDTDIPPFTSTSHILTPISGRYVQLVENSTMTLNNAVSVITLYNSSKNKITEVTNPRVLYDINNTTYSKYLIDVVPTGVTANDRYILIDLLVDTPITFIVVTLINSTYFPNLNNAELRIIGNDGIKLFSYFFRSPTIINYIVTDINRINVSGTYYTDNYAYPQCKNAGACNNVVPNKQYILSGGNCFKANTTIDSNCTVATCLDYLQYFTFDNVINIIDTNFSTCIVGVDSRYDWSSINATWRLIDLSHLYDISNNVLTAYNLPVYSWKSMENSSILYTKQGSDSSLAKLIRGKTCVEMADTFNYNSFIGPIVKILNFSIFIVFDDKRSNGTANTAPVMLWKNRLDGNSDNYQFYMSRVSNNSYNIGIKNLFTDINVNITGASDSYAIFGIQVRLSGTTVTLKYINKYDTAVTTRTDTISSTDAATYANTMTTITLNAMASSSTAITSGKSRYYAINVYSRELLDADMINLKNLMLTYMSIALSVVFNIDSSVSTSLFQDTAETTPSTLFSVVKKWKDQSSYLNHATKGVGGGSADRIMLVPLFWNNKPVVSFNRDSLSLVETKINQGFTEGTIFIVASIGTTQCVSPLNNRDTDSVMGNMFYNTLITDNFGSITTNTIMSTTSTYNAPVIYAIVAGEYNNSVNYYINNITTPLQTFTPFNGNLEKSYSIGGDSISTNTDTYGYIGLLAEIKIYNIPLTDTTSPTLKSAFDTISDKWGVNNFSLSTGVSALIFGDNTTGKEIVYSGNITMVNNSTRGYVLSSPGSSYIMTTKQYKFGPSYTIMCRVYYSISPSGVMALVAHADNPVGHSGGYGYIFGIKYGTINSAHGNINLSQTSGRGIMSVRRDTWSHIALTYNNDNYTFTSYVNGILDQSKGLASNRWNGCTSRINIMAYNSSSNYYPGMMSELYIFNRVLSAAEISTYANRNSTNMIGRYIYIYRYLGTGNVSVGSVEANNGTTRYPATTGSVIIGGISGIYSDLNGDGLTQKVSIAGNMQSCIKLDLGTDVTVTSIVIKPAATFESELLNASMVFVNNNGEQIRSVHGLPSSTITIYRS